MEITGVAWRWAADLKRRVNALASPIYSIPDELLQGTIEIALDKTDIDQYYRDLHRLRSVSARWCQTIDNSPRLWTVITSAMPTATVKLTAERSRQLPLDINYNAERAEDWLAAIISHQARWESLRVQSRRQVTLASFLSATSPKLTSIVLSGPSGGILGSFVEDFLSKSPNIRTLQITEWGFHWNASFATNIRSLALERMDQGTPNLKDVINMLSCCAKLASLRIRGVQFYPSEDDTLYLAEHPAHLPSLQNLSLDFNSIAPITLSSFVIPHSTQMTLDGTFTYDKAWIFESFVPWMARASIGWTCSDSVAITEDKNGRHIMWYGEGHFRIVVPRMGFDEFARFLSWLDVERREATTVVEYDQVQYFDSEYDHMDVLDQLFPSATHFKFGTINPCELQKIFRSLSKPQADEEGRLEKWLFLELEHITIRGSVTAVQLISFASARISAADDLEVSRLVDITAFGLTGTDAERSRLGQLVRIIDS